MNRTESRTNNRKALRLLALLLAAAMLLGGCSGIKKPSGTPDGGNTGGDYDMVAFDEMPYHRPDMTAMELLFNETADFADAATEKDSKELADRLERCWDAYDEYYTMEALAMVRSDIDQTDEFYAAEYEFFLTNDAYVEDWLDTLLIACACSDASVPASLLAGYTVEDSEPYSDRAVELMAQEGELLRDYWQVMQLDNIEIDGRVQSYSDYIASPFISNEQYRAANMAYYRAINAAATPIYIKLIKVRRALAEELGYNSYEEYQYAVYGRDYTPGQVRTYLDSVAGDVSGFYRTFMSTNTYSLIYYAPLSSTRLLELLQKTTSHMGSNVTEAFAFMKEYHLYDVTATSRKAPGAYTIYFSSYDAPFCFLGAYGDVEDFLDLAHEFGHFVDNRVNFNATASLDLAETYSQGMANLALLKSKEYLSPDSYRNLLLLHLLSNLSIFAEQAAYADFESRVYALPDEELTEENVNALALDCARRYGVTASPEDEEFCAIYWSQVNHLFEQPFYVISYCVSADAAIQIAEKEMAEPGAGVKCYEDILDWKDGSFLAELDRVGLISPFAPGRAAHNLELVESLVDTELGDLLDAA